MDAKADDEMDEKCGNKNEEEDDKKENLLLEMGDTSTMFEA